MPFVRDLKPSQERSDEVARMQKFLSKKGYLSIASDEYGYYGKKTQAAIDKFQKANGIPKASQYGWWYPKTREAANKQLT
jgi:peptidoglycan hydrolase-like protein with peptidoglycan-binding domain